MYRFIIILLLLVVTLYGVYCMPTQIVDGMSANYIILLRNPNPSVRYVCNGLSQLYNFTLIHVYQYAINGCSIAANEISYLELLNNVAVSNIYNVTLFNATSLSSSTGLSRTYIAYQDRKNNTKLPHVDTNIAIGILDTGIDLHNTILHSRNGVNCIDGVIAQDDNGHGTQIASIVDSTIPDVTLFAIKVLDAQAQGNLATMICGLDWLTSNAIQHDILVASITATSVGIANNVLLYQVLLTTMLYTNVTIVVSAGNNNSSISNIVPAVYQEVLTVTAITDSDGRPNSRGPNINPIGCQLGYGDGDDTYASYSNYDDTPPYLAISSRQHIIAAPGTCINSTTLGGEYVYTTGTSVATALATGVVALCLSGYWCHTNIPHYPEAVVHKMVAAAQQDAQPLSTIPNYQPITAPGTNRYYGYLLAPLYNY